MKFISVAVMFFVVCMSNGLQAAPLEGNAGKMVHLLMKKSDDVTTDRILILIKKLTSSEVQGHFFDDGFDDVDSCYKNATMLHLAVIYGNIQVVQALIECGADLEAKNFRGHTSRDLAIAFNRRDLLYVLAAKNMIKEFEELRYLSQDFEIED